MSPESSPDAQYRSDLPAHLTHPVVPAPLVLADISSAERYGRHHVLRRDQWATLGGRQLCLFLSSTLNGPMYLGANFHFILNLRIPRIGDTFKYT